MSKSGLILTSVDAASETRLNSESTMNDGEVTIIKKLYFKVPYGENPREYNDLDVYGHPLFPKKYSALSQDARYKFYGNATVHHQMDGGHYFTAELEYSTKEPNATDSDGNAVNSNTPPWKLRPEEIEFSYPEINVSFDAAYNNKGELYTKDSSGVYIPVIPVTNTAGDPFLLEKSVRNIKISFTFAAKTWHILNAIEFGNTINAEEINVVGLKIKSGRALLLPPECSYVVVYEDNSSKIKWKYWRVRVEIIVDMTGLLFSRMVLNVGDRALFPNITLSGDALLGNRQLGGNLSQPSQICRFRQYTQENLTGGKYRVTQNGLSVFGSWDQFIQFRSAAISESARLSDLSSTTNYTGGIVDPQCEQMTKMPLVVSGSNAGQLDYNAIQTKQYGSLSFLEYPYKSWLSLNLPQKGIDW